MFYKKWKQGCKDKIFIRLAFSLEDSRGQAGCKSICIAPGFSDIRLRLGITNKICSALGFFVYLQRYEEDEYAQNHSRTCCSGGTLLHRM